jgi:hypothetical protein
MSLCTCLNLTDRFNAFRLSATAGGYDFSLKYVSHPSLLFHSLMFFSLFPNLLVFSALVDGTPLPPPVGRTIAINRSFRHQPPMNSSLQRFIFPEALVRNGPSMLRLLTVSYRKGKWMVAHSSIATQPKISNALDSVPLTSTDFWTPMPWQISRKSHLSHLSSAPLTHGR